MVESGEKEVENFQATPVSGGRSSINASDKKGFWRRGTVVAVDSSKEDMIDDYPDYINIPYLGKFEYNPGVSFGQGWGVYGSKKKIFTFNGSKVRHYLAPFLTPDLTVCDFWHVWFQHFAYLVYALFLMIYLAIGVGDTVFPDGHLGAGWTCVNFAGDPKNQAICQTENVLDEARSEFRFLIAFILAGYVGTAVNTWNERRSHYGTLCGKTRAVLLLVSGALPIPLGYKQLGDTTQDDLQELRQLINRWSLLAYELANLKSQGLVETDTGRTYLEKKNVLRKGEWESMVPGDRHTTVFFWMTTKLNNLPSGMIPDGLGQNIISGIVEMRGAANDMMDCICTDQPFPYVALCGLLVKLNVLIMSTWAGIRWSIWYWAFGHDIWNQPKIWIDLFVLFTWNISYVCLYDLGYLLYNPFKDRRIDLAHEAISNGIHKLAEDLAEGQMSCIPPTMGSLSRA